MLERKRERGGGKRGIWRSADYAEQNEQLAEKATKKKKNHYQSQRGRWEEMRDT